MAELFDADRLRVTKIRNAYCVTLDDFVNMEQSPVYFITDDSWEGHILHEWWEATPLIHLPLIDLLNIWRKLHQEAGE